jgi:hypothetical protein
MDVILGLYFHADANFFDSRTKGALIRITFDETKDAAFVLTQF